jgi:diguanylate cyclase (GGDEF)-like protein/PAS domain S-box-containing protein
MGSGDGWGKKPLLFQFSIRLLRGMAGAILIIGLMAAWVLQLSQEKSAWREIRNATEYFSEGVKDRERRWAEAAVRYKSRLEFARLLEDSREQWTRLNSYLLSQNNGELFPVLLLTDMVGRVKYSFGMADEAIPVVFSIPPDMGWYFDKHSQTLYRYYVLQMWLGTEGMGHIVLMQPMDQTLLGQFATLNTHLFLRWDGRVIASSIGERGREISLRPRPGSLEYDGFRYMQDSFQWEENHPQSPELVIHREVDSLFDYWEVTIGIGVALAALFAAQWASMGLWVYRTTRRITLVGKASHQFTEQGRPSPEMKQLLSEACRPREDEINEVAKSIETLAFTVAQRDAERDANEATLRENEARIRESEEKFRLISTSAMDAILIIDPEEKIAYWNPAAGRMFGYTEEEALGQNLHLLLTPHRFREDAHRGFHLFRRTGTGPLIGKTLETSALRKDGEEFPIELSISTLSIDSQWQALGIIRDISERKKAEEQIRNLAYYDTLTELPNRRLLVDRLNQALSQAKRHRRALAVMFLDLDRFKAINDPLGHDAGDELLQQVAKRLVSCVRSGDTVSRQGGDEFVIVLAEIAQPTDAAFVAEKIIDFLQQPFSIKGQVLQITISIGIAIYPVDGADDAQELMKKADMAMYSAKEAGRNDYRFFVQ